MSVETKRPVIIDCDPGIDDAVAIFLAASYEGFDIKAVTSVAGNVNIDFTTQNALDLCHRAGLDTIVARGAAEAMIVPTEDASYAHGARGLGTVTLDKSPRELDPRHAWDVIYDEAVKAQGELEIIALGPLTNLAILITKYPDVYDYISKITIMGGSRMWGNVNAYGEYNLWADPHAADIVFKSNIPMAMVELESIFRGKLTSADWEELTADKTPMGDLVMEIMRHKAERGEGIQDKVYHKSDDPSPYLCDAMTVACAIDPSIVKYARLYTYMDVSEGPSRGRTMIDFPNKMGKSRNCQVSMEIDRLGFKRVMADMFKYYKEKGI